MVHNVITSYSIHYTKLYDIYRLQAPERGNDIYQVGEISLKDGGDLANPAINFIIADKDSGIWVGTAVGLKYFSLETKSDSHTEATQVFSKELSFTCGVADGKYLYFGTRMNGLLRMDLEQKKLEKLSITGLNDVVNLVKLRSDGKLLIGTRITSYNVCYTKLLRCSHVEIFTRAAYIGIRIVRKNDWVFIFSVAQVGIP